MACAAPATPGPRSAPGSASPARPPSNAGEPGHDPARDPARRSRARCRLAARGIRRHRHRRTRRPHRRCPGPQDHLRAQDPARRRFPHAGHRPGLPRSRQVVAVTADTAATAALGPEPITGSGPGATADDTMTVSWADFRTWERQLTTCTHPIRLRGRIDAIDLATGELASVYNTD